MAQYEFEKKKLYNLIGDKITTVLEDNNAFIAGGAITSLFCNREVNDFDIYFREVDDCISFMEDIMLLGWICNYTKKAILFKNKEGVLFQCIIFDYYKKSEDIFDSFDFTVCMGAFSFKEKKFVLHKDFLKHNSQRIIKFNSDTSYPIISLMRLQKYKEKGYSYSKLEYIKMIITCMKLELNTVEEAKEQLGGMYGYDLELLFEDMPKNFSIDNILQKLYTIDNTQLVSYLVNPDNNMKDFDFEEMLLSIFKLENFEYITDIEDSNSLYIITSKQLNFYSIKKEKIPDGVVIHDFCKYFKNYKFYKFVKRTKDNKLVSIFKSNFEYKIGEIITPLNGHVDGCYYDGKIYCGLKNYWNSFPNSNEDNSVMLEIEIIEGNDIVSLDTTNTAIKKGKVVRIVPKKEYGKW